MAGLRQTCSSRHQGCICAGLTEEQCSELAAPQEEQSPLGPDEDEDAWPELGAQASNGGTHDTPVLNDSEVLPQPCIQPVMPLKQEHVAVFPLLQCVSTSSAASGRASVIGRVQELRASAMQRPSIVLERSGSGTYCRRQLESGHCRVGIPRVMK